MSNGICIFCVIYFYSGNTLYLIFMIDKTKQRSYNIVLNQDNKEVTS